MMKKETNEALVSFLDERFPDARCALYFCTGFECLVAVMLSAQTTDAAVNQVTPALFTAFPDAKAMANAKVEEVEAIIHSLGLYRNKAKNLIAMSKELIEKHSGTVPPFKQDLVKLPGVGVKTANVVSMEVYGIPSIAVDTHVARIAKRLGYAKPSDDPVTIERKLEANFDPEQQGHLHHQLIWFGRQICHARNPECGQCGLTEVCPYFKKSSSTKGK